MLLDQVALALRSAAEQQGHPSHFIPLPQQPAPPPGAVERHPYAAIDEHGPALPQILQPRQPPPLPAQHRSRHDARALASQRTGSLVPVLLGSLGAGLALLSVLVVAVVTLAPASGPLTTSAATAPSAAVFASMQTEPPIAVRQVATQPVVVLDAAELGQLVAQGRALVDGGDIAAARALLAPVAAQGHGPARFALAETFDPNMLAAWGLREVTADTAMARDLYAQALKSGETRARQRLIQLGARP